MKPSTFVGILLITIGIVASLSRREREPEPQPQPRPDRPSAELVAAVQPVVALLKNHRDDGRRLSALYMAMADVIARDQDGIIQTTAQLRELHRRAGLLAFQRTGIAGKYPGLAEAIDKVLADHIGLEVTPMDAARRTKAVDAFRALAWACGGGDA